jgi:hypothetical protein
MSGYSALACLEPRRIIGQRSIQLNAGRVGYVEGVELLVLMGMAEQAST